jgi:hypothetical protein
MSIEKYEIDSFKKEQIPFDFTILPNIVLQNFTNEALSLWVHLMSLPAAWKVNREYLMKKFGYGRDKLEKQIKSLIDHHLLSYEYIRDKGKVKSVIIIVKNGKDYFNIILKNKVHRTTTLKTRVVAKSADFTTTLKNHSLDNPHHIKQTRSQAKKKQPTNKQKNVVVVSAVAKGEKRKAKSKAESKTPPKTKDLKKADFEHFEEMNSLY